MVEYGLSAKSECNFGESCSGFMPARRWIRFAITQRSVHAGAIFPLAFVALAFVAMIYWKGIGVNGNIEQASKRFQGTVEK
jgi:hypothetical protein